MERRSRGGVTLVEVVVAILVLSVGALALAGSAAITVRRMAESGRRATAASVARTRAETSFAGACASLSDGSERLFGVRSEWLVSTGSNSADLRQRVSYPTRNGDHADEFLTAAECQ